MLARGAPAPPARCSAARWRCSGCDWPRRRPAVGGVGRRTHRAAFGGRRLWRVDRRRLRAAGARACVDGQPGRAVPRHRRRRTAHAARRLGAHRSGPALVVGALVAHAAGPALRPGLRRRGGGAAAVCWRACCAACARWRAGCSPRRALDRRLEACARAVDAAATGLAAARGVAVAGLGADAAGGLHAGGGVAAAHHRRHRAARGTRRWCSTTCRPTRVALLRDVLSSAPGLQRVQTAPLVLGRLAAVNGEVLARKRRWPSAPRRGARRAEAEPPRGNIDDVVIDRGAWWPEDDRGAPLVAMEDREADQIGLQVGDTPALRDHGQTVEADAGGHLQRSGACSRACGWRRSSATACSTPSSPARWARPSCRPTTPSRRRTASPRQRRTSSPCAPRRCSDTTRA